MPDLFIADQPKSDKPVSPNTHATPTPDTGGFVDALAKTAKAPPVPTHHKPTNMVHAFSAFVEFPKNISFENQETNEHILLFVRKHFITNLPWIITTFFAALIPLLFIPFFQPVLTSVGLEIPGPYVLVILLFYYLILGSYGFLTYILWFYNSGIVTNMRVVDIDLTDITHKNVAATAVIDIVDVEYSQKGFLQSFVDFGNVHMQTEGLKANFEFLQIPHPGKSADIINDLLREAKK